VIDVLEAIGARYASWGGLAVVAYGEPRFTQDLDILLSPEGFAVSLLVRRLGETHYHVDEISVRQAMTGGYFNVIHLGYHVKTDLYVPVEPELRAMIAERVTLPFDETRRAAYVTPTAAIEAKLRAYDLIFAQIEHISIQNDIIHANRGRFYCRNGQNNTFPNK